MIFLYHVELLFMYAGNIKEEWEFIRAWAYGAKTDISSQYKKESFLIQSFLCLLQFGTVHHDVQRASYMPGFARYMFFLKKWNVILCEDIVSALTLGVRHVLCSCQWPAGWCQGPSLNRYSSEMMVWQKKKTKKQTKNKQKKSKHLSSSLPRSWRHTEKGECVVWRSEKPFELAPFFSLVCVSAYVCVRARPQNASISMSFGKHRDQWPGECNSRVLRRPSGNY